MRFSRMLCVALLIAAAQASGAEPDRLQIEFFEKRIRPVLIEKCYKCHSVESKKSKGGLLLDSRESLLKGGDNGPVIVAGEPDKSSLYLALRHTDPELEMPPDEILPADQIEDFKAWIKMGAPDPRKQTAAQAKALTIDFDEARKFWAFQPPKETPPLQVKNTAWPVSPIDNFILARLEANGFTPAPPAEKRTLIRRATFDLIGLPPTPEEIDAFVADSSPEAFEKLIDRLLASPRYGERWGRHWLDVARYADSNGFDENVHFDNAWRYRDYVIAAFNRDHPFDQFVREQLAGDHMPGKTEAETYERMIATGFLVMGPKILAERDKPKLTLDVIDEQLDTTARAFMGLTLGCARCHDHKYDPIPTRDYYALAGFFKSTTTLFGNKRGNCNVSGWLERPLAPPDAVKAYKDHALAVKTLQDKIKAAAKPKVAAAKPAAAPAPANVGVSVARLTGIVVDNIDAKLSGMWKESTHMPNFVGATYIHDDKTEKGKKSVKFTPDLPQAGRYEVRFAYTGADGRAKNVPVTIQHRDGKQTVLVDESIKPPIDGMFVSLGVFEFEAGKKASVTVSNENTDAYVIADCVQFLLDDGTKKPSLLPGNEVRKDLPPPAQKKDAAPAVAAPNPEKEQLEAQLKELQAKAPPALPMAMAVEDGKVENCRICIRGNHETQGEEVPRGFLTIIPGKPVTIDPATSGRLQLADWIASPENPLTARVAVNRIWHHLFGRGLVTSPDNFGMLGERPSHPEILDHLALRFVADGWSFKKTIKRIMLTNTYRMSTRFNAQHYAKDPDNKLYWRANRRRLQGEAIRDAILQISGQLDLTMGGSLIKEKKEVAIDNNSKVEAVTLAPRRSVYLTIIRNDVVDILQAFDFVDPHVITGRRDNTTVATQALYMMNSPFMREQAQLVAKALLAQPGDDAQRVVSAYLRAYGRPATTSEISRAIRHVNAYAEQFKQAKPNAAAEAQLEGWRSFCQMLLVSTEFRFID